MADDAFLLRRYSWRVPATSTRMNQRAVGGSSERSNTGSEAAKCVIGDNDKSGSTNDPVILPARCLRTRDLRQNRLVLFAFGKAEHRMLAPKCPRGNNESASRASGDANGHSCIPSLVRAMC